MPGNTLIQRRDPERLCQGRSDVGQRAPRLFVGTTFGREFSLHRRARLFQCVARALGCQLLRADQKSEFLELRAQLRFLCYGLCGDRFLGVRCLERLVDRLFPERSLPFHSIHHPGSQPLELALRLLNGKAFGIKGLAILDKRAVGIGFRCLDRLDPPDLGLIQQEPGFVMRLPCYLELRRQIASQRIQHSTTAESPDQPAQK